MTANNHTGSAGKGVTDSPRVTARAEKTSTGEVRVEYEYWGRTFNSAAELEAALRGERHEL